MKLLHDFDGLAIRFTDERRAHILEHPEMMEMALAIEEALARPEKVVAFAQRRDCSTLLSILFSYRRWW